MPLFNRRLRIYNPRIRRLWISLAAFAMVCTFLLLIKYDWIEFPLKEDTTLVEPLPLSLQQHSADYQSKQSIGVSQVFLPSDKDLVDSHQSVDDQSKDESIDLDSSDVESSNQEQELPNDHQIPRPNQPPSPIDNQKKKNLDADRKPSPSSARDRFKIGQFSKEEIQGGQPSDPLVASKRETVKQMTLYAWQAYKRYAWGANELKPVSRKPHNPPLFDRYPLGLTIVDSLDTLFIMGLDKEVAEGLDFITNSLNFDVVLTVRNALEQAAHNSTYYNYVTRTNPPTFCNKQATLSGLGDSFYEYLLKEWIRTGRSDTKSLLLYDASVNALLDEGIVQYSQRNHLTYLGEIQAGRVKPSMGHLACFAGGMFALASVTTNRGKQDTNHAKTSPTSFELGSQITSTCRYAYAATDTHLGPETFTFSASIEARAVRSDQMGYLLRPETVESYFYLWRFTKDPKYRQWAWDMVEALQNYTMIDGGGGGFSGLRNVQSTAPSHDDVQQSFFLAETLKYLYLIFSDDTLLPLDRWVFNTEAHPFPIRGDGGAKLQGVESH